MTPVFCCGAECKIAGTQAVADLDLVAGAAHWDTATSTVVLETTIVPPGGTTSYKFTGANNDLLSKKLPSAMQTLSCRYYFYATIPATGSFKKLITFLGPSFNLDAWVDASGNVYVAVDFLGGSSPSAGTLVANTWNYVDVSVDCSATTYVMKVRLNSGAEQTISATGGTIQAMTAVEIGAQAWTGFVYGDDFIIAALADYPIGPGHVNGYVPTAAGTHVQTAGDFKTQVPANITSGDGSWADIDELPANITDYIAQVVIRSTSYAEYIYGTSGVSRIPRAVEQIVSIVSSATAADTEKAQLYDGTTAADAYALRTAGSATAPQTRSKQWAAPPSGGAWTIAKAQALRIRWGFSTDITPNPRLTNTCLEMEFPPTNPRSAVMIA